MMNAGEQVFEPQDWVRVRASTDGQSSFLTWQGSIYAFIPGRQTQLIFKMIGMSVARCVLNPDGIWYLLTRELSFYLDPNTKEKIDRWDNPWTGETLPVVHVANNLVQRGLKYPFKAIVQPDTTTFIVDLFPSYPNALATDTRLAQYSPQSFYQAAELFKFTVATADLISTTTPTIAMMQLTWDRIGPWLPWMKLGNDAGYLLYSAYGYKLSNFTELPSLLQNEINDRVPLYKTAPEHYIDRKDVTSWTYFQQHFEAYLRSETFPIQE